MVHHSSKKWLEVIWLDMRVAHLTTFLDNVFIQTTKHVQNYAASRYIYICASGHENTENFFSGNDHNSNMYVLEYQFLYFSVFCFCIQFLYSAFWISDLNLTLGICNYFQPFNLCILLRMISVAVLKLYIFPNIFQICKKKIGTFSFFHPETKGCKFVKYTMYINVYNGNKGCTPVFAGFKGFSGSFWASWKEGPSSKCLMFIDSFIAIYIWLLNIQL